MTKISVFILAILAITAAPNLARAEAAAPTDSYAFSASGLKLKHGCGALVSGISHLTPPDGAGVNLSCSKNINNQDVLGATIAIPRAALAHAQFAFQGTSENRILAADCQAAIKDIKRLRRSDGLLGAIKLSPTCTSSVTTKNPITHKNVTTEVLNLTATVISPRPVAKVVYSYKTGALNGAYWARFFWDTSTGYYIDAQADYLLILKAQTDTRFASTQMLPLDSTGLPVTKKPSNGQYLDVTDSLGFDFAIDQSAQPGDTYELVVRGTFWNGAWRGFDPAECEDLAPRLASLTRTDARGGVLAVGAHCLNYTQRGQGEFGTFNQNYAKLVIDLEVIQPQP